MHEFWPLLNLLEIFENGLMLSRNSNTSSGTPNPTEVNAFECIMNSSSRCVEQFFDNHSWRALTYLHSTCLLVKRVELTLLAAKHVLLRVIEAGQYVHCVRIDGLRTTVAGS